MNGGGGRSEKERSPEAGFRRAAAKVIDEKPTRRGGTRQGKMRVYRH